MTIKEREEEFQDALRLYRETEDKQYWDIMYYRVYDCCHNIAAKKLIGVKLDPSVFEDRLMDATLYVMKRIKEGLNPQKLSSYCYLCVIGRFFSKKAQFEDKIVAVDKFFAETEYEVYNEERI